MSLRRKPFSVKELFPVFLYFMEVIFEKIMDYFLTALNSLNSLFSFEISIRIISVKHCYVNYLMSVSTFVNLCTFLRMMGFDLFLKFFHVRKCISHKANPTPTNTSAFGRVCCRGSNPISIFSTSSL